MGEVLARMAVKCCPGYLETRSLLVLRRSARIQNPGSARKPSGVGMVLNELLKSRKAEVCHRWQDRILQSYGSKAASFIKSQKDPFANPVGSLLYRATEATLDQLLVLQRIDRLEEALEEFVKLRAVQDFRPSEAVGFIGLLKECVLEESGKELSEPERFREVLEFFDSIDRLSILVFDFYSRCREQVYQLRFEEIRRFRGPRKNRYPLGRSDSPEPGEVQ